MRKLLPFIAAAMLTGCASYQIKDSDGKIISQGNTTGFGRTITVIEEYNEAGRCLKRQITTESNIKEAFGALNELMDTTIDTAAKIKP
jgi:hypothetical protein